MARASDETKTLAFIDLATEETARLQALASSMSSSEIIKASLDLLGKATVALANGLEFGSRKGRNGPPRSGLRAPSGNAQSRPQILPAEG